MERVSSILFLPFPYSSSSFARFSFFLLSRLPLASYAPFSLPGLAVGKEEIRSKKSSPCVQSLSCFPFFPGIPNFFLQRFPLLLLPTLFPPLIRVLGPKLQQPGNLLPDWVDSPPPSRMSPPIPFLFFSVSFSDGPRVRCISRTVLKLRKLRCLHSGFRAVSHSFPLLLHSFFFSLFAPLSFFLWSGPSIFFPRFPTWMFFPSPQTSVSRRGWSYILRHTSQGQTALFLSSFPFLFSLSIDSPFFPWFRLSAQPFWVTMIPSIRHAGQKYLSLLSPCCGSLPFFSLSLQVVVILFHPAFFCSFLLDLGIPFPSLPPVLWLGGFVVLDRQTGLPAWAGVSLRLV